jgi:hypothetical protein
MKLVSLLTIAVVLLHSGALVGTKPSCGDFPATGFDAPDMARFVGEYTNPNYGFSVHIPDGLVGHSSPAPNPQHGFGVILSWEPRAYIFFDGSYTIETDASATPSVDQVQAQALGWLREESGRIISVRQTQTRLGSLPARRQVVRRSCENHSDVFVVDEVIALRGGITFTAALLSVKQRYSDDRRIFERFLRTWRLAKID